MELSLGMIILIFIAVSAAVTFLIKRYLKADTYLLISLIKTQKPLAFFDRMSKHKRFLDIFSAIGLYMGFGAIAMDFVYGRKMGGVKRAALFAGSFLSLSGMLWAVDAFILNSGLSTSILIGPTFPLLLAVFGISGLAGFTLFSLFLQAADIIAKYFIGVKGCPGVAPLIPGVMGSSVLESTGFCGQEYASSAHGMMLPGDVIKSVGGAEVRNLSDLFAQLQKDRLAGKTFVIDRNSAAVTTTPAPN